MDLADTATLEFTVTDDDTAVALGSGSLAVLATPRLLAWCEAATCAAIETSITDDQSSVGTRVQLDHVGASAVGAVVSVTATIVYVDGRLVRFEVVAQQGPEEKVVAHGEVTRVVVDRARFLSRLTLTLANAGRGQPRAARRGSCEPGPEGSAGLGRDPEHVRIGRDGVHRLRVTGSGKTGSGSRRAVADDGGSSR